jgi:IS4 transposase
LVTTLLDPHQYPAQDLADLYGQRWQIETNLRHLKQTMKMDVLHCETVAGVLKELTVFALVYNLVRTVMHAAAVRQEVPVERISFADALG